VIAIFRRVLSIGLGWAIVWGALWAIVGVIIGVVDPDSIDPGESAMAVAVLGPMGLLSGIAFGILLSIGDRGRSNLHLSLTRVVGWGILPSAIVQLAYLDHGDLGLAARSGWPCSSVPSVASSRSSGSRWLGRGRTGGQRCRHPSEASLPASHCREPVRAVMLRPAG
jgi:hypothetical protein